MPVPKRLIITLVLLVTVPLVILGWLGARLVRAEQAMVREQYTDLLNRELLSIDQDITAFLVEFEQDFIRVARANPGDPGEALLRAGLADQFAAIPAQDGKALPVLPERMGPAAIEFWEQVVSAWSATRDGPSPEAESMAPGRKSTSGLARGWHTWYEGEGLQFLYWWRDTADTMNCVQANRARLLMDLIAALPETDALDPILTSGRIALRDARGNVLYQWGAYDPAEDTRGQVTQTLSPPLHAWQLTYYMEPALLNGTGRSLSFALAAGLAALILVLILLAVYLYRESVRDMREAAQRITFVNQVSHELKTPLTNIRMYAELMEGALEEESQKGKLRIIVGESQRLSRLIGNILTFSRKQRNQLQLHPQPARIADILENVIAALRPSLESRDIQIELEPPLPQTVQIDVDALEQILYNLISNAEKYAAAGRYIGIRAVTHNSETRINVEDRGPGIPPADMGRIFEPFYRASNKLTDGVAGSGIGLAIARELARQHGGDLTVTNRTDGGACFTCTLNTPPAEEIRA
jgi:signal transduction histidine kinase